MKIEKNILKNGQARYRVDVIVEGERLRKTFRTKKQAQQWEADTASGLFSGGAQKRRRARGLVFSEVAECYLLHRSGQVAAKSALMLKTFLRFWSDFFKDTSLDRIHQPLIVEGMKLLSRDGRKPSVVNQYRGAVVQVFRFAVHYALMLDSDPTQHLPRLKNQPPVAREYRWLAQPEISRLLAACKESSCSVLYLIVSMTLATGSRLDEVLSLTWQAVDLETGRVTYDAEGFARVVAVKNDELLSMMAELFQNRRAGSVYCFPSPKEDRPLDCRRSWEGASKRAGLAGLKPSDLQATVVDLLFRGGGSLQKIAGFVGKRDDLVWTLISPEAREAYRERRLEGFSQRLTPVLVEIDG